MAYQLSDLVSQVQLRVRDSAYSPSQITSLINDCQNDVFNEYRLLFMETTASFTTVANVADITNGAGLPVNFTQAIDLCDNTSGTPVLIPYKDIRLIDRLNWGSHETIITIPGPWECWYFYAETMNLDPAPATVYTLLLRYYKKATVLVADTDVPAIPSQFSELLVVGAAYRVKQIKGNYDEAAVLQNKYDEILSKLVMQSVQKQVGSPTQMRINRYHVAKRHF